MNSNSNSNNYRVSNEQLLLINILNTMYNDNLRQINNLTDALRNIQDSNNQIRNLIVQLLNVRRTNSNTRQTQHSFNRTNTTNNLGRVYVNNRPYIIDSISEFTIPRSSLNDTNDSFTQLFNSFMQPVEVYPTQSQIEAATRIVRYCDITRPANNQCPISLENFNDNDMVTVIRPCGHIFNTENINNWFRSNCRCPVCRYDIRDYSSTASTEFFNGEQGTNSSSNNNLERNNNNNSTNSTNSTNSNNSNNNRNNNRNNSYQTISETYVDFLTDASGNYISDMSSDTILTNYLLNLLNQTRRS